MSTEVNIYKYKKKNNTYSKDVIKKYVFTDIVLIVIHNYYPYKTVILFRIYKPTLFHFQFTQFTIRRILSVKVIIHI